jgi:hypothetical protein
MGRNRFVAVNVGPTGAGKSTVTENIILPKSPGPVYIVDPQHEYFPEGSIIFDGENNQQNNPVRDLFEYLSGLVRGEYEQKRYLVIRTSKKSRSLATKQGNDLFRRIATCRLPGTLVVDEANRWTTSRKCFEPLHDCIIEGGHFGGQERGLSLVFCARRIAYLGKDITSNAQCTILFRQSESNDIKRASNVGFDSHAVRNLQGHQYLTLTKTDVPFEDDLDPAPST